MRSEKAIGARKRSAVALVLTALVALLAPGLVPVAEAVPTAFAAGSYIIPMDEAQQNLGMWKAYGLVYRLASVGIPVQWGIAQGKAYNGIDFSVPTVVNQRTGAAVAPAPYIYRGGPFVIAQADVAAALPVISAWWTANGNQPTVHRATAGFTADIDIALRRAPRIANEAINAGISIAYYNAAGIPDDNGNVWSTSSPNILNEAAIAGGALLETTGTCGRRKWDAFVTPHNSGYAYSLSDPANLGTRTYSQLDKFVFLGGGWIAMCHSILSNENAIVDLYQNSNAAVRALFLSTQNTGFLTQNGFSATANGGGTWKVDDPGAPSLPIAQSLSTSGANQGLPGGSVQTWLHSGVTYLAGVERVAYFENGANQYDHIANGVYHGGDGRGKLSFIGGHSFSTALPYSSNSEGPYLRAFYDALFFNGAAVAKLELSTSPSSISAGVPSNFQILMKNTGASVSTGLNAIAITLEPGIAYLGMAAGPNPTCHPACGSVLAWPALPDLAAGATGLAINVQATYATPGSYSFASLVAGYGDTFGELFTTNDCSTLTVVPAPVPVVTKSPSSQGPFPSGAAVDWTLDYTNAGLVNLLNGVVEDILPAGFVFQTSVPAATSVVPLGDGTTRVRWSVGTLAAAGTGTIDLTALAPSIGVPLQTFTNSATFSGTDATGFTFTSPASTATVSVAKPALELNKSVSPTTVAGPGSVLTYTITPTYQDNQPLTNAVITDPIPANTTYVPGSANAGGIFGGGAVTWPLGSNSLGVSGASAAPGFGYCPATVTLPGVADTYIDENNATSNFGADTTFRTRPAKAGAIKHSLVRFDVSSIPAGAVIQGARMTLRVTQAGAKHFDKIYRMATAWTEAGATWNRRDGLVSWAGGGAFGSADYAGSVIGTFVPNPNNVFRSVDIATAVSAWVSGTTNNGLVLLSTGTDAGDAQYASRTNGTVGNRPQLVVTYLVLTPDQGGGVACSGTPTLTSVADTYVNKNNATTNDGANNTIVTNPGNNNTTNNTRHGLLQFDLSGIPPGATINSATLTLTVTANRTNHVDNVRRITTPWVEGGATWNTRDGTTSWAGGGSFSAADYAATNYGSFTPSSNGAKTLDVAALVNDWVNNGFPNRGLALVSTGTDNGNAQYGSKENGGREPTLAVNWTLPTTGATSTRVELATTPYLVTGAGSVTVTMTVTATVGTATGVTPPAALVVNSTGPTAVLASGPTPAGPVTLDAAGTASATFTYVYNVTPGTTPGTLSFSGKPTASAPFFIGVSNETIVTPALTFQVTVNGGLPLSVTQVQNIASLTDDNFFADPVVATALTTIGQPLLTLSKTNSPSGSVGPNDVITYTLTLRNDGTGPAAAVSVTDAVPANTGYVAASCTGTGGTTCSHGGPGRGTVTWTVGALAAGASRTLTFQVRTVITLAVGTYTVSNLANVTATGVAAVPSNTVTNTLSVVPALSITKSQTSNSPDNATGIVHPGNTIDYSLLIANTGFPAAANVVVTDTIPVGTTFVSASNLGVYNAGTRTITWPAFALAAGASVTRTFRVTVNSPALDGQAVTNAASLTATGLPATAFSNQVSYTISATPSLSVVKSAVPASATAVTPGQVITYTLQVSNAGTANTDSAFITDAIPAGTTYVANTTTLNGTAVPELTPGVAPVENNMSVFSPGLGDPDGDGGILAVASPATITFQVRVQNPIPNGFSILNTTLAAVGSFAGCPSPVCATSNTTSHPLSSLADLAVTKTVDTSLGSAAVYRITVTNLSATNYASGVRLFEPLAAGLTLRTGCVPNNDCWEEDPGVRPAQDQGSYDTVTHLWTVSGAWNSAVGPAPLAPGASATLILVCDVDQNHVGMIVNTASLNSVEQTDSVAANNSASASVNPVLTRATVRGLRVDPSGLVEFATGMQSGTLSFDLYAVEGRGTKAVWTRLHDSPIPTPRPDSQTPILYQVHTPAFTAPYLAIVERDVKGREHLLGPFTVGDPRLLLAFEAVEKSLSDSGAVSGKTPGHGQDRARVVRAAKAERRADHRARRHARRRASAGLDGVKLETRGEGPLGVSRATLEAAGLPAAIRLKKVKLTNRGRLVPFSVLGAGASETLSFRAEALRTLYSDTNFYVVSWDKAPAPTGVPLSVSEAPAPAGFTRIQKSNQFVALTPEGIDPWHWDILWGDGSSWPYPDWTEPGVSRFDLPGLASGAGQAPVRLALWGYTPSSSHRVAAWINDIPVGDVEFSGSVGAVLQGSVPLGVLRPAGNTLRLSYTSSDGVNGYVYFRYLDIGAPLAGPGSATLERVDGYDSSLPAKLGASDTLIVTHSAFAEQAARLAGLKRAEGRKVEVVDVSRAYDRYTGGVVEAGAIHALIRAAGASGKLRQVLLFGDDSLDPSDYLGLDSVSYVPSLFAWDGELGRVPSENRYADFDGDAAPEVAIGRLPANDAEQARVLVDKIASQVQTLRASEKRQLFVVDDSTKEGEAFEADARTMAALLPERTPQAWARVADGWQYDPVAQAWELKATATLRDALAVGAASTHYFGHGSTEQWAEPTVLDPAQAASLDGPPSVVFTWACLAGYYLNVWGPSVNEALLLNPAGGALASFGPAGITSTEAQGVLFTALYDELRNPSLTLGEAIRRAKVRAIAADPLARPAVEGWNFLGDPSLPAALLGFAR